MSTPRCQTTPLAQPTEDYLTDLAATLQKAVTLARPAISKAARLMADCFSADGLVYVFGSGHSHMFAEEAFYRAGGLARVSPMLVPKYMLHMGAERSTKLERTVGLGASVLDAYEPVPQRDIVLVVSNSGANALPVEVAQTAKSRGLGVIAITSVTYANHSEATGPRLHQVADVVLDNCCPPGDALVELAPNLSRIGPASSIIGFTLLNAMLVQAAAVQLEAGQEPDIYLSAGIPGAAPHNQELANRFRGRIKHI